MEKNISTRNADRLAGLSVVFFALNNLPYDAELISVFSQMVMSAIGKWYKENEGRLINPETELICDDAIKFAFDRAQQIAVLANISVQTGIGMEM
jgi:hypothetical protein